MSEPDLQASMADSFCGNTAYAYHFVDRLTQVKTPRSEVFGANYNLVQRGDGVGGTTTQIQNR